MTELVITNRVLGPLCKDLENLRVSEDVTFSVRPLVWVGPEGEKVYRPPGIWCDYNRDRHGVGAKLLFWFPAPYHPLEALAAYRGLGGIKESALGEMMTNAEHAHIARLNGLRFNGWLTWTQELARALILFPAQVRLLYHALTPLRTNGAEPETTVAMQAVRPQLYQACGLDWSDLEIPTHYPNGVPSRMQFFDGEVDGRIEL